jgi:hypothetical protein
MGSGGLAFGLVFGKKKNMFSRAKEILLLALTLFHLALLQILFAS